MTTAETTGIAGLIVALVSLLSSLGFIAYQANRNKNKDLEDHEKRLSAVETKVGLFWHLVEEHMSGFLLTANPIQFTPDEKAAALAYDRRKAESPTYVLRTLEGALDRELRVKKEEIPRDEMFAFTLILSAIKAQLMDRGERVNYNG